MGKNISFLIPAYNDEGTIDQVIAEATRVGRRLARKFEIVVINDGSGDRTGIILVRLAKKVSRLRVITHPINRGYGTTIKELYYAGKHEWLFTIPGDYQVGARELEKLIPHTKTADMILGWRVKRNDPGNRLIVSWIYNRLIQLVFGVSFHDINSVRLMRRSILDDVTLTSSSAYVDAELVIRAMRLGYMIVEVPIAHRARVDGERGRGNQWRTIAGTIIDMVRFFL